MKSYETPSSISSYAYCERLGSLNKLIPFGGSKSVATVIGNVEHASFQEYYNFFRLDCLKHGVETFKKDNECHEIRLSKVLQYVRDTFKFIYPSFYQHILDEIPSIKYRLDLHHQQKLQYIQRLTQKSRSNFTKAVSMALPFAMEKKLAAYNIVGRVDCIYKASDGSIIAEDLKSHATRFDSLIHQDSHKIQLTAYAVLLEREYQLPVNSARILYTKDLTYENFKISKKDKIRVLEMKDELQSILAEGLPPIIDDPLKCKHCYKRNLCKKIDDDNVTVPTEYISLDGDQN